jgi:cold shock CspA family protein
MPERAVGVLVSWNPIKGYGYLHRDHGEDVSVSRKDVRYSGINEDDLRIGLRLSFVPTTDDPRGPRATHIRVISEAPA